MEPLQQNAVLLDAELNWFSEILVARFDRYFQREGATVDIYDIPPPNLERHNGPYAQFMASLGEVLGKGFSGTEMELRELWIAHRLTVLLALTPHVRPQALDVFFSKNPMTDRPFTEFGGVTDKQHSGFLPTGETIMFLLAGGDLSRRHTLLQLFSKDHYFNTANVLTLSQQGREPVLSGVLTLSVEYLTLFTTGDTSQARNQDTFPAQDLQTKLAWDELVVPISLRQQLEEIVIWVKHEDVVLNDWGLGNRLKPGYRALFHGPSGTGKTLSAALLGKRLERPVYRIDLSRVISKYIGETEKNLSQVFDQAENKNWILFFDEADALFGKRTTVQDANHRYANQEVSYLLQRIENHSGLVILTTSMKDNLDGAFLRRFQATLHFPVPDAKQRLQLWQQTLGTTLSLAGDVDLKQLATDYELTGGSILNVVRYCATAALQRGDNTVQQKDFLTGIRRELQKQGKVS